MNRDDSPRETLFTEEGLTLPLPEEGEEDMEKQFVRDRVPNARVTSVFAVKSKSLASFRNKPGQYMNLVLCDRTGEIKGLPSGGLVTLQRRPAEKDCILHLLYGVPVKRGETRVMLSDASKFGRTALIKVCDFKDINRLITDGIPDAKLAAVLQEAGVSVNVVAH